MCAETPEGSLTDRDGSGSVSPKVQESEFDRRE